MLEACERLHALVTLAIIVLSGFSSALMVGTVPPFRSVLSDPSLIKEKRALLCGLAVLMSDKAECTGDNENHELVI